MDEELIVLDAMDIEEIEEEYNSPELLEAERAWREVCATEVGI